MALILVPTLAVVALAGLQVTSSVTTAAHYQQVNDLARLADGVARLTHELQAERDQAAWHAAIGRPEKVTEAVVAQTALVDQVVTQVRQLGRATRSKLGARASAEVDTMLRELDGLGALRKQAVQENLLPSAIMKQYSLLIETLLALQDELAMTAHDDELATTAATLAHLAKAKESASVQRGLLTTVLPTGRFEQIQLRDFLGAAAGQERDLRAFRMSATRQQRDDFDAAVSSDTTQRIDMLRTLVLDRAGAGFSLKGLNVATRDDTGQWYDAMTEYLNGVRAVEGRLTSAIVTRSQSLKDDEQRRALIVAVAVGVLLIVVLVITVAVIRSLVRPLRRLRAESLEIAKHRLPEMVQRLREAGDSGETPHIPPIGVNTRDEIGEVARAFDEVHREAVRLAGDEARLRSNVNAMFVNLSRRTQTLVERQLSLIDGLEQGEQDEQRLGDLFKLDHLATRMRRNSENLLVLAGQEPARRWGQPVPIVDVVRASLSEVENYERVNLQVQPGVAIVGQSVNDVVHLVAELVENAISFSSRETKVTVSTSQIDGGGLIISVSDMGIGMTAEELAQANHRLANPPVVDVSVSRRMGLFVVGRLALRHGIRVQLRQQETGGLTAMVLLPESLLTQTGRPFHGVPGMPQPDVTGSAPSFGTSPQMGGTAFGPPTPASAAFDTGAVSFGSRTSAFGADAPDIASPGGDFAGVPFQSGPREDLTGAGPFPRDPARSATAWGAPADPLTRDPLVSPPADTMSGAAPGPAASPVTEPFSTGSFGPGQMGDAPLDTPWPGHLPPPGGTAWPGAEDRSAGWPGARPTSGAFDSASTGPLPVVHASPLEAEEEYLPIFAAVESDWFKRADAAHRSSSDGSAEPSSWSSPADAGWQAAKAVSDPTLGGITSSGLPKRVPKANLVPGSAAPASSVESAASTATPAAPSPLLSPERVRSRLSSFQHGIRQGRAAARGEGGEIPGPSGVQAAGDLGSSPPSGAPQDQDPEKEDS